MKNLLRPLTRARRLLDLFIDYEIKRVDLLEETRLQEGDRDMDQIQYSDHDLNKDLNPYKHTQKDNYHKRLTSLFIFLKALRKAITSLSTDSSKTGKTEGSKTLP